MTASKDTMYACRSRKLYFMLRLKIERKGDLSYFECGVVVGIRHAALSILETAQIPQTIISRVLRE